MNKILKVLDYIFPGLLTSLLGPGLISFIYVFLFWLIGEPIWPVTFASALGSFMFVAFVDGDLEGEYGGYRAHLVIGILVYAMLAVANALLNTPFSLTRTTLLAFGSVIFLGLGRTLIGRYIERSQRRKCEAQARAEEKKEQLISKVKQLVGDDILARGFIRALDDLTKHVPDQATELLEALTSDLEEYQVLESLIGSTRNELLRQRSIERMEAIQSTVQQTCAEVTEEAVEIIRLQQMAEADAVLGNKDEPRLVQARENFSHFLGGLREVRNITSPPADQLIEEIEPKPEIRQIGPSKSA
jgi:hypothetical protein